MEKTLLELRQNGRYRDEVAVEMDKTPDKGYGIVYHSVVRGLRSGAEAPVLARHLWARDIPDVIAELDIGGINTIILADSSTELMAIIYKFLEGGWRVASNTIIDDAPALSLIKEERETHDNA